ncbi:MAG: nucleoside-diphosphate kinase [Rhizobiaceae bacterium]|nr:nucleoside-diphosphate kinase [Rhizobiaceae bacterium]
MSRDTCILTTKDHTILEVMLDRCANPASEMASLLRKKIRSAQIVFRDDVPPNVVTLSSRVTFSINGKPSDTRVIAHERMHHPVGLFLPLTTPRAVAMLGMLEGQAFRFPVEGGLSETIVVERILYQPEAARRERDAMPEVSRARPRPVLTVIEGARNRSPEAVGVRPNGFDDPGPSAA